MISFFRRALSSPILLGLLALVLVAFIVTGINDPFGGGGAASGTSFAKVGKTELSEIELGKQFDRLMQRMREQQPELTAAAAVREGAIEQVADQLVGGEALQQFARALGLAVGKAQVDSEIAAVPAFAGPSGKFDQTVYEQAIARQRLTDRELREGLEGDLLRRQLLVPALAGNAVPRLLVTPYVQLLMENRTASIAFVPAAAFAPGEPTAAQVQAHYKANIAKVTIPERRSFTYALLDKTQLEQGVTVSEAEISDYYRKHDDLYGATSTRTLSQAVVQDRGVADAIVKRVRGGADFVATAGALAQLTAEDMALGEQTQAQFAAATSAEVAKAAFGLAQGGVSDPVKSDFGWHVVHADAVTETPAKPLASVRDEIERTVRAEKAATAFAELTATIEDAIDGGESLSDVAKANGLALVTVPAVTRTGQMEGNSDFKGDARIAPVLEKVFTIDAEEGAVVEPITEALAVVLAIDRVVPPTPVPLERVRAAMVLDWKRSEANRRAKAAADAILAEVDKGKDLNAALAARQLPPARSVSGRRLDLAREQNVAPPVALAFALPEKGMRVLAAPQAAGQFIVRVDKVTPTDETPDAALVDNLRAQMSRVAAEELAAQFTRAAQGEVGVSRNAAAINRVKQRYLAAAPAQP